MQSQFRNRLLSTVLILICCCPLTGCVGPAVRHMGTAYEKITPQNAVYLKDGMIAIEAISMAYKKSVFDGKTSTPLSRHEPRPCFVVMSEAFLDRRIQQICNRAGKNIPVDHLAVPRRYAAGNNETLDVLPAFDTANARRFAINDPIPFEFKGKVVYLDFGNCNIRSDRVQRSWWVYPALIPAIAIDIPFGWAGLFVAPKYSLYKIEREFDD